MKNNSVSLKQWPHDLNHNVRKLLMLVAGLSGYAESSEHLRGAEPDGISNWSRDIIAIAKEVTAQAEIVTDMLPPMKDKPDFKFGRARPTLTSIMPYCHNGERVITALCEICGTIKGFTPDRHSKFPESGYWTECRSCQSYTMFYRIDGHTYIKRKHVGRGEGL